MWYINTIAYPSSACTVPAVEDPLDARATGQWVYSDGQECSIGRPQRRRLGAGVQLFSAKQSMFRFININYGHQKLQPFSALYQMAYVVANSLRERLAPNVLVCCYGNIALEKLQSQ